MKKKSYSIKRPIHQVSLWKDKSPILSRLDMELTERCNNNCIHCYINLPADEEKARKKELTTGDAMGILKQAASLGCLTVRFTGGEPLLREDFEEIYLFARRLGLKVRIFTNGTLVTTHLANLLSRIPPLEKIEVSIYGMKRKPYEAVSRVPGSFHAARRGIDLLLKNNVPFVVKAVLFNPDKNEAREFEEWSRTIPWMDFPQSSVIQLYLRCRGTDEGRNTLIKGLRLPAKEMLNIEAKRPEEYRKELKTFCSQFCRIPEEKLFWCGAGIGGGCVDAYGNLQPCLMLRHPSTVYDLKKGSLKDGLENFFPKVREMEAVNPLYLERCARCFLQSLCAQCPAVSWMETRALDGWLEYFCEFTHAQAQYIGLLREGEKSWEVADWEEKVRSISDKETPSQKNTDKIHCSK